MPKAFGPRPVIRRGLWLKPGTEFEIALDEVEFLTDQGFVISDVDIEDPEESQGTKTDEDAKSTESDNPKSEDVNIQPGDDSKGKSVSTTEKPKK